MLSRHPLFQRGKIQTESEIQGRSQHLAHLSKSHQFGMQGAGLLLEGAVSRPGASTWRRQSSSRVFQDLCSVHAQNSVPLWYSAHLWILVECLPSKLHEVRDSACPAQPCPPSVSPVLCLVTMVGGGVPTCSYPDHGHSLQSNLPLLLFPHAATFSPASPSTNFFPFFSSPLNSHFLGKSFCETLVSLVFTPVAPSASFSQHFPQLLIHALLSLLD